MSTAPTDRPALDAAPARDAPPAPAPDAPAFDAPASEPPSAARAPAAPATGVMPPRLTLLFALTCGLAVGNAYAPQPLLDEIARTFGVGRDAIGVVVTATQLGLGAALLLVVPLGDLLPRRRLVAVQLLVGAGALVLVGTASSAGVLLAGAALVGASSVVTQVLVPYAATLAAPADRGRVVGTVTGGVVLGILLARTVAGGIAQVAGWRAVPLVSAGLTLAVGALLVHALPRTDRPRPATTYGALLRSLPGLVRRSPLLRVRGALAFLVFAAFSTLWTALVLPLSAPPHDLSHAAVGAFGLAGVAGAVAAGRAGRLADRGRGQRTTGVALLLLVVSWGPIALLDRSLVVLAAGIVLLDLAVQAVHVSSQTMLLGERPEARSRVTALYMACYSAGSATGAALGTAAYGAAGWAGTCGVGAGWSLAALLVWAATRRR